MIERLRALGTSERTLAAFARVPRYRLVPRFWLPSDGAEVAVDDDPAAALALLYDVDRAVAVNHVPGARGGTTSTASAPRVLTAQADVMAVEPGMAVLEIGTGPGYFAAVLAELVGEQGRVVTIDIDARVAGDAATRLAACGYERVVVRTGDGADRALVDGPFDRIVASVGCNDVAAAWFASLSPAGRVLVPLRHGATHPMVDAGADRRGRIVMGSAYVAIQGRQAGRSPWPFADQVVALPESTTLDGAERAAVAPDDGDASLFGRRESDLGYWVALEDRRAGYLASLHDGAGSAARLDARAGTLAWGGPSGSVLAQELRLHLERWHAAGRPRAEEYGHEFVPHAQDPAAVRETHGRWVISRVDHDQVVTR